MRPLADGSGHRGDRLGLTYGLVEQQRLANATLAQVRFTEEVRSSTYALSQRITTYTEFTAGLRDLFLVNPYLRFDQFQQVTSIHNVGEITLKYALCPLSAGCPTRRCPPMPSACRSRPCALAWPCQPCPAQCVRNTSC